MREIFTLIIAFWLSVLPSLAQKSNQGNGSSNRDSKSKSDTLNVVEGISALNMFSEPFSPVEPFRKMEAPPSPQMASLGKFGETPVNHSTGIANIGIPIHTVSVNGYSHSIGLSYHGGGIKVNQVSSNVGLGWALNASGVLANTSNKIGGDYVQLPTNFSTFNPNTSTTSFTDSRNNVDYMWAHDGLNNCYDTEPDVINFNFGSQSGVMVPVYQGVYREVPYTGLTIMDLGNSYVVYDKNNTKYTFDIIETTHLPPGCPGSLYMESEGCINVGIYNNSYYLSKIESKEGGVINFFYEDENYSYALNRTEQKYSWVTGNGCLPDTNLPDVNCIQVSTVTGKRLIRIETSENEQILFKYKNESSGDGTRQDLPGTKALQFIEIYNLGDVLPVRKIEFVSTYFTSSGSTGPNHESAWDKRLKLDQVIIDTDQVYSLSYNGNLAPRLSYDQDYYGYHIFNYIYSSLPYHSTLNPSGANREPSSSRVTAGLLNKITYPTKGYSTFEYEPNMVYFSNQNKVGPGVRIKRINSYSDTNTLAKYVDYKYIEETSTNSSGIIDNLQSSVNFIDQQTQWQHDPDTGPYRLECYVNLISSDDQMSSFMGRSYQITYSRVEEIINDGSEGKMVYHFSKIGDIVPNPSVSIAQINYDWTYGIPTKTEFFKETGTNIQKIEEKSFQYKTFITNNNTFQANAGPSSYYSFGMKLNRERAEVEPGQQWVFKPAIYNLYKYGFVSALVSKIKETTKVFENGVAFESHVNYSIDSINNQITKSVFRESGATSDGKSRYFYYTNEIGGGQGNYYLYKEPILYLDKIIRGGVEYTTGGAYYPLSSSNGFSVFQKAYTIDLQNSTSTYNLILSNPPSSTGFRLASEVLSYNAKNYPTLYRNIETETKILYDNTGAKPLAQVQNFNGSESNIAFSSFEYTSDKGGWSYSGTQNSTTYKTGKKAYNLSSGSITKTGIGASASIPYKVGFWAKRTSGTGNVNVGGQTEALTTTWKWVEKTITSSSLTISGSSVIIDELRLHPADAMMTSYTYEPLVGMTSQTDPRGYTLIYIYDTANRLQTIKDEDGNVVEHYEYNYANGN